MFKVIQVGKNKKVIKLYLKKENMRFFKEIAAGLGIHAVKISNRILISDTTLRDGEQTAGAAMKIDDKVEVARALEDIGVDSIEAGFPIASKVDFEAGVAIAKALNKSSVSMLSRCLERDIDVASNALKDAKVRKSISLFIATSPLQREKRFKRSKEEIIDLAVKAVKYAKSKCDLVSFGAEDGTRTEPEYIYQINEAVIDAGARVVSIADTLGILTPEETSTWVKGYRTKIPNISKALIATHFHNDLGMGLANALAAIRAGAHIVQTTVNGIGERAGNVALEELAFILHFKKKLYGKSHGVDISKLHALSKLVYEKMGISAHASKPIVGDKIFVTAAGLHQTAIEIDPAIYEPFPPSIVGAPATYMELSRHSSVAGLRWRLKRLGYNGSDQEIQKIFTQFKELANEQKLVCDEEIKRLLNICSQSIGGTSGSLCLLSILFQDVAQVGYQWI